MGKRKEESIFDSDGAVDVEAMRGERGKPIEYTAPGARQRWRARDLVDIHWKLTGIKTPSESYNRIMSCIIGHANPNTGHCYMYHSTIAAETDYSVKTVKRAIQWWVQKGFLKTEGRGIGRALAYHPQWDMFEMFYVAAAVEIAAQKEATRGTPVGHQGDLRGGHRGDLRMGHHGDLYESQRATPKDESHPERVHDASPLPCQGKASASEEGFQVVKVDNSVKSPEAEREAHIANLEKKLGRQIGQRWQR